MSLDARPGAPGAGERWRNYGDVLSARADEAPGAEALVFLGDGERDEVRVSYGEMERRTRGIGGLLQSVARPGERALLLYPPGIEYVMALFACFRTGIVAVPAYPPDPARLQRTLPRLRSMVQDARARLVLTLESIRSMAGLVFTHAPDLAELRWLATDVGGGPELASADIPPDSLALLQYTSGSTADPRGVMLTHANLLRNSAFIYRAFGHSQASQGVIWLPPYHDMGLIGGVLQPIYGGFPCALMSPLAFLQRPVRWFQAISKYRATTSGGPNFAYDLCVRRIRPEQCEGLDLSSWDVAFNGAETVRSATLDAFVARFGALGFRGEAFYPCYGLAEGTLAVSGGVKSAAPIVRRFSVKALEHNLVASPADDTDARWLVGSGGPDAGHSIVIADPATRAECAPDHVGEIWTTGASVAFGYWNRAEQTQETFGAALTDGRGPFLRTGDLGFLDAGELFVTGRLKDVLVVQGRNFYPQDIEIAAERAHADLRHNCGAAFTVELDGRDRLVVVHEVEAGRPVDHEAVALAIRAAVAAAVDLQVHTIVLIGPRTLPKTSSGKAQHSLCRSLFLKRELESVYTWSLTG